MTEPIEEFLGVGLYSVSEASRLTKVHVARIRRWLFGYHAKQRHYPALWKPEIPPDETEIQTIGFQDLIEIQFINAFRSSGVSWKTIRLAAARARDLLNSDHPFSSNSFRTDGITIFADIAEESKEKALLDLVKHQYTFRKLILPSLHKTLVFSASDEDTPVEWWPMGKRKKIVLDPDRQFGQPIVSEESIPTSILARSHAAMQSVSKVAYWYRVQPSSVRQALEFENSPASA